MSYKLEKSDVPGYFNTEKKGKEIEWQAKISDYYSQITGIKFCVIDDEHQNVESNKLGKLLESAPAPAQNAPVVQNGHVNILA